MRGEPPLKRGLNDLDVRDADGEWSALMFVNACWVAGMVAEGRLGKAKRKRVILRDLRVDVGLYLREKRIYEADIINLRCDEPPLKRGLN